MKTIWKVLAGAAALAAVTPYSVKKDEETGELKLKSATWSATYTPAMNGADKKVVVNLLPDVAGLIKKSAECDCEDDECCCDECCEEEEGETVLTVEVDPDEETEDAAHEETGEE